MQDQHELSPGAREIFEAVVKAMQDAEEIWGPGPEDYVPLMEAIAAEATGRIKAFKEQAEPVGQIEWTALSNGRYRVMGKGFADGRNFCADVHSYRHGDRTVYSVDSCNNVMINAQDIAAWCEANIQ
jgi:hypothetical protein